MLRYRYLIMMMKGSYDVERLPAACYLAAALAMYCSRASFRFLVQASVNQDEGCSVSCVKREWL